MFAATTMPCMQRARVGASQVFLVPCGLIVTEQKKKKLARSSPCHPYRGKNRLAPNILQAWNLMLCPEALTGRSDGDAAGAGGRASSLLLRCPSPPPFFSLADGPALPLMGG